MAQSLLGGRINHSRPVAQATQQYRLAQTYVSRYRSGRIEGKWTAPQAPWLNAFCNA